MQLKKCPNNKFKRKKTKKQNRSWKTINRKLLILHASQRVRHKTLILSSSNQFTEHTQLQPKYSELNNSQAYVKLLILCIAFNKWRIISNTAITAQFTSVQQMHKTLPVNFLEEQLVNKSSQFLRQIPQKTTYI